MSYINAYIEQINKQQQKALSIFLTAGFPSKHSFMDLALNILDAGADMIEIGMPFSDPIADGPVIQSASQIALEQGTSLEDAFTYAANIRSKTDKPLILMGYANPLLAYGLEQFIQDARSSGVNGLIIPDVPLEEHENFWQHKSEGLDIILLTTPTSNNERIAEIDRLSSGFVYCVSVTGITGIRNSFDRAVMDNIDRTYTQIKKNKMLIGFGISNAQNVREFAPYCDGVIVGSAVVKSIMADHKNNNNYATTLKLVKQLSAACKRQVY
jgi:tryptophan synthase alpha chain